MNIKQMLFITAFAAAFFALPVVRNGICCIPVSSIGKGVVVGFSKFATLVSTGEISIPTPPEVDTTAGVTCMITLVAEFMLMAYIALMSFVYGLVWLGSKK